MGCLPFCCRGVAREDVLLSFRFCSVILSLDSPMGFRLVLYDITHDGLWGQFRHIQTFNWGVTLQLTSFSDDIKAWAKAWKRAWIQRALSESQK
jgi:hypothetical protein